jgi:hypothetical protein
MNSKTGITFSIVAIAGVMVLFASGPLVIYIEGAIKDGNVIKLFVSSEGKGGCKIILRPEQTTVGT